MANHTIPSDLSVFHTQWSVLSSPALCDAAKLLFCELMCDNGLRAGWLLTDPHWNEEARRLLHELGQAGHLYIDNDGDGHLRVGLYLCNPPVPA